MKKILAKSLKKGDYFRCFEHEVGYLVCEVDDDRLTALNLGSGGGTKPFDFLWDGSFHNPWQKHVFLLDEEDVQEMIAGIDRDIAEYHRKVLQNNIYIVWAKIVEWVREDFKTAVENGERMQ